MNDQRKKLAADVAKVVKKLNLDVLDASVISEIALDFDGYEQGAASSILAAATNRDAGDIAQALIRLSGSGLVRTNLVDGHARVVADFDAMRVPPNLRERIRVTQPSPFTILDAPHAPAAMSSLHQLFVEEARPIFIGLEMTSHDVFKRLAERAAAGRFTTFIMPKRKLISDGRREQYDTILSGWKRFIRNLPGSSRRQIRLRLTGTPYRYLYTSTLTASLVRFDCYWYNQGTTRRGTMVVAAADSSLYDLVHREYNGAMERSTPLFSLWPRAWIEAKLGRFTPLVVVAVLLGVAGVLEVFFDRITGVHFLVAFLCGLAGEAVWEQIREMRRLKRGLFDE